MGLEELIRLGGINVLIKEVQGTGEMAQLVKQLLHKLRGLNVIPRMHVKSRIVIVHPCNLNNAVRWEMD